MNNTQTPLLPTLVASFALLLFVARGFAATLQVATDAEKEGGPLVELTAAALARVGHTMEIHYLPWKRALEKSMDGEFDMLLGAYHNEEREALLSYSQPIGQVELCLVKRRGDDIRYTSLDGLKPYRIGQIRGATVSPEFDLAARTILNIEYVSHFEYNIRKLLAGRIDLLIDKKFMFEKTMLEKYPDSVAMVEILSPPLQVFSFYNAFPRRRPDHPAHLAAFNLGLARIRADGTLAAIYRRHGVDYPPDSPPSGIGHDDLALPLETRQQ